MASAQFSGISQSAECLEENASPMQTPRHRGEGPRRGRGEDVPASHQKPGPPSLVIQHVTLYNMCFKSFFGWDNVGQGRHPPGAAAPCPGEEVSTKQAKLASVRTGWRGQRERRSWKDSCGRRGGEPGITLGCLLGQLSALTTGPGEGEDVKEAHKHQVGQVSGRY